MNPEIPTSAAMIDFQLDGMPVSARPGETIWQVAHRLGIGLPHLCYTPAAGYRPDGNCRVCVVEVVGERVLTPSCNRNPTPGMKVNTTSARAQSARSLVMELIVADQPPRSEAHDPDSKLWNWAELLGVTTSRFPAKPQHHDADPSHSAIAVQLDSCINCNLCVRACREVQVNDVIGMAHRGHKSTIVFDFEDDMGSSTCVGCGECVQACPTGALLPKSLLGPSLNIEVIVENSVDTLCPYCGVGCQTSVQVADNRVVSVIGRDGPANHARLCVKGRFGFDFISHPDRLTKPLIRKKGVPKSSTDQVDPSNPWTHFREASWEEALDFAAAGLKKIRDEVGPNALAGFGSAKGSNEEAYLFQKMIRTGFGTNNVDHCTRLCHASSVSALLQMIGSGSVTASFAECANSDVIFVIGANPTVNHPVAATFIKNAVKRGATLIVADPRGQTLSRHAKYQLHFRAGTDVALLNAFLNVIVNEQLYDHSFVTARTEEFDALKEGLETSTPEAMAPICGIEPNTIREVARTFGNAKAAMIFWGMGISQHVHGTDNARCLINLALLTGNIGRPGTGVHPLRGQNNVQGASDSGLIPMFFPDYRSVADPKYHQFYEELWGSSLDTKPGLTVVEIMKAAKAGKIRGIYIEGENPAMSDPDLNHAREALASLDHLVVQEIFLTETAWHADVVLPAAAFSEKSGTFTNTDRRVQLGRPAVSPPGDARQDWWIIQEVANRLGLDWKYSGPRDVFHEMRQCLHGFQGITWERLETEGSVTYPCDDLEHVGHDVIFDDHFPTATGKAKLVPTAFSPPDEVPDSEYPMILSTGRVLEHWHTGSMTRRSFVLDDIEPEAQVRVHPFDLRKTGVEPGDLVEVSTRRGAIQLKAMADRDVPIGLVFIPFCFAEAAANLLTNPTLDPFGKIPEFKFCACKIEPTRAVSQV